MAIRSKVIREADDRYFFRNGWGISGIWEEALDRGGCAEVGKEDKEHAGEIGEVGLWGMVFWDIGGSS